MRIGSTRPSRRRLLGLTGGAGFVALAGCLDTLGSSESEPEFDVEIRETNAPVEDGSILEVTVGIENTGSDDARDTLTLDVAGLQPTSDVSLDAGETTETTLTARLDTGGDGGTFEATVESLEDSATTEITVLRPAEISFEVTELTEEVVAGETLEVDVLVANEGEVSEATTVSLEVEDLVRNPETTEITLDEGGSESVHLEWETDESATSTEQITVRVGEDDQTYDVSILEPAETTLTIEETNAPIIEGEPLEVDLLIENAGEEEITEPVRSVVDGTELSAEEVTLDGQSERSLTLTGVPTVSNGEHELEIEYHDSTERTPFEVRFPVSVVESSLRETPEAAAELIETTLGNEEDEPITVRVDGVIELPEQPVQFEPPRAISEPVRLTYRIPEGTHEQQRVVTVPPGEERDVTLKVPVEPWPFDVSYLPGGEALSLEYDYDVSLTGVDAEETVPEPHERVIVSEIQIAEIAITDRLIATVENISDEPVSIDIVGVLEDAAGDMDDNISRRVSVSLDPGESTQIEFEDIGALLDIPGLPFVEVDGTRENTGLNTGLLVDVEELE